jgi:cation transport regulator ChaB
LVYESINDLPKIVRNLPKPAKTLFLRAFNSAWEEHSQIENEIIREKEAQEAAWSAVRGVYEKDEETGEWVKIGDLSGSGRSRHSIKHRRNRGSAATQPEAHA